MKWEGFAVEWGGLNETGRICGRAGRIKQNGEDYM